jgi:hypothetical protein
MTNDKQDDTAPPCAEAEGQITLPGVELEGKGTLSLDGQGVIVLPRPGSMGPRG